MRTPLYRLAALSLLTAANVFAAIPPVALKPVVVNQFDSPTTISNAGDGSGRLFILEQRGKIRIVRNGMLLPTPFLDVSAKLVSERAGFDERGLLGLAFHPGYTNPASPGFRKFYIFYSATSPNAPGPATDPVNCRSTLAEYQVSAGNPDVADLASERVMLTFDKPQFNHNGGQLEFGADGFLYLTTGDGGGSNDNDPGHVGGSAAKPSGGLGNAQDKTRLLGKMLRLDPLGNNGPGGQYGIPATNPFVGAGGGVREEIYAFGLRNPWRFSFDAPTGRLFCADLGQNKVEEVDLIVPGGNYGWRLKEGKPDFDATAPNLNPPLIPPIAEYAHLATVIGTPALPQIGASVTGGYVYRGSQFPALVGKYIFADWGPSTSVASGTLLGLEETAPDTWALSTLTVVGGNPIPLHFPTFGRDEQGEIYVATKLTQAPSQVGAITGKATGSLYKIVPASAATVGSLVLEPAKDNTLFSESENSNGEGVYLFGGRIATNALRRALLAFDATQLPNGALVNSASLALNMNKGGGGGQLAFVLHRALEDWGEGASNAGDPGGQGVPAEPGDATWTNRFFPNTPWTTPGGRFSASASATTLIEALGSYVWTSATLAAEVQAWRDNPLINFGWILTGDETVTSAKRFNSREDPTPSLRPKLTVNYVFAPPATRREEWLQQYFPIGQFVDDQADIEGDGNANQIEYALGYSPLAANPPALAPLVSPDGTQFVVTFRRDPRATDLTYRLQTSGNLIDWTTVVESIGGAVPTGSALVSDELIAPEVPLRLVTAQEALVASQRFARLVVLRQP
jgi:glucose/arabinose dehydrogenase